MHFVEKPQHFFGTVEGRGDELGEGFEDVDWKKLDPRQYDPRRIIREALLEEEPMLGAELNKPKSSKRLAPGDSAPFDSEST